MARLNVSFPEAKRKFEILMKKQLLIKSIFYKRIFGSKGLEFDGYREYYPFVDDASLIDWKATMRNAGKPLVRQYISQQRLKMFFLIDVGDNMVFGSSDKLKNEAAAEIVSAIANLVVLYGDEVGFALYSDNIKKLIMPMAGSKQIYLIEEALSDSSYYGGKSNLEKAIRFLMPNLKNINAVFVVSDFIKIDEPCSKLLKTFINTYETIGIMVRDRVDMTMPDLPNEIVVEDIYTGEQEVINPEIIKYAYEKYALEQKKQVEDIFSKVGSDLVDISIDEDFIAELAGSLRTKVRERNLNLSQLM